MDLNPSTTAVIACHFENDIVGANGAFAPFFRTQIDQRNVLDAAGRLLNGVRAKNAQVVYVRVAFQAGHSDLVSNTPLLSMVAQQGSLLDDSFGSEIINELKPADDDWIVTNPKVSAFASSNLDERLRQAGIDTVVLFGVATNVSVESSGRAAGDLGYRVIIASDACSAASEEAHQATLDSFGLLGEVASTDEILSAL
ncbi:cysteine hydrolase [Dietzia sp. UCD-THP]|uniref:isochorismatase family cysteine hydrolase n=1 Tax=Dietzia sp. UCD-THP TaxID=1292020 RepID=UPI000365043A|nr:isochorismatase family cysteine hydrolase [Dietzia sp. UCD-THP]EYT51861.1 cysteine hydrolase [Dietzia sp. UCD-THP]